MDEDESTIAGMWTPSWAGEWIDVGNGVAITKPKEIVTRVDPATQEPVKRELSSYWSHKRPDGHPCGLGRISYEVHTLVSTDPISLEPSILCHGKFCGKHGFIRSGKWTNA